MIFGVALVFTLLAGGVGATALALRAALRADEIEDRVMFTFIGGLALCGVLFLLFLVTTDWGSVPDGCYRIVTTEHITTTTSIGPNGGVAVTPIVSSGRTYFPIQCP